MKRFYVLLIVSLLGLAVPACWSLAADETDPCAMGYGGDDGFGGEGGGGFGGGDVGTGFGGSDVGTGIGGSDVGVGPSSSDVGVGPSSSDVGVGPSSGAGGGFSARPVPHRVRRRHRRGGLGVARQADCPLVPSMMMPVPNWQPLTTAKLRQIAIYNNIEGCQFQTGVQQNRTIGLAFEDWVLTTIGLYPSPPKPGRNTMPYMSQARQAKTGGLPASVIPEFVADQTKTNVDLGAMAVNTVVFEKSAFFEVEAVTKPITRSTSKWQILGLLDVANVVPTRPDAGPYPPPLVCFITTGGTTIDQDVVTQASMWNVAVWQKQVYYDANDANPNNPNLRLEDSTCLNPNLYATLSSYQVLSGPWPVSPLTSPTTAPSALFLQDDPDPAEVD